MKKKDVGKVNLNLVNYQVLNSQGKSFNYYNSEDLYSIIEKAFPGEYIGEKKLGRSKRISIGTNGSTSYIYSGPSKTDITIPNAHEKDIKEKLEMNGLTLGGRKCL